MCVMMRVASRLHSPLSFGKHGHFDHYYKLDPPPPLYSKELTRLHKQGDHRPTEGMGLRIVPQSNAERYIEPTPFQPLARDTEVGAYGLDWLSKKAQTFFRINESEVLVHYIYMHGLVMMRNAQRWCNSRVAASIRVLYVNIQHHAVIIIVFCCFSCIILRRSDTTILSVLLLLRWIAAGDAHCQKSNNRDCSSKRWRAHVLQQPPPRATWLRRQFHF